MDRRLQACIESRLVQELLNAHQHRIMKSLSSQRACKLSALASGLGGAMAAEHRTVAQAMGQMGHCGLLAHDVPAGIWPAVWEAAAALGRLYQQHPMPLVHFWSAFCGCGDPSASLAQRIMMQIRPMLDRRLEDLAADQRKERQGRLVSQASASCDEDERDDQLAALFG